MSTKDIRWKQRAQNFEKAFLRLKEAMEMEDLNELERNGLIQRFEFTIDLAWKVMKDYLEYKGFDFKPSPKDTIRLAQESEFIDYAQELIDHIQRVGVHFYRHRKKEISADGQNGSRQ